MAYLVYLRFNLKLSICVAKDRHRFYIREACFTLSNSSECNIFLLHFLVHMTSCLDLLYIFSTLPMKDRLMQRLSDFVLFTFMYYGI